MISPLTPSLVAAHRQISSRDQIPQHPLHAPLAHHRPTWSLASGCGCCHLQIYLASCSSLSDGCTVGGMCGWISSSRSDTFIRFSGSSMSALREDRQVSPSLVSCV